MWMQWLLILPTLLGPTGVGCQDPAATIESIEKTKTALNAVNELMKIFDADLFQAANNERLKSLSLETSASTAAVVSLMQDSPESADSGELSRLREQFAAVHSALDSISLPTVEVKKLLEWRTAQQVSAQCEEFIKATWAVLSRYISATDKDARARFRNDFLAAFERDILAPLKLFQAVTKSDSIISRNLVTLVVQLTRGDPKHVGNFMLDMLRLVIRAAGLELAYERLQHGEKAANVTRMIWERRLDVLLREMREVDEDIRES